MKIRHGNRKTNLKQKTNVRWDLNCDNGQKYLRKQKEWKNKGKIRGGPYGHHTWYRGGWDDGGSKL